MIVAENAPRRRGSMGTGHAMRLAVCQPDAHNQPAVVHANAMARAGGANVPGVIKRLKGRRNLAGHPPGPPMIRAGNDECPRIIQMIDQMQARLDNWENNKQ